MEINELSQEELAYEMGARGVPIGTVEAMRKSIRTSCLLEKGGLVDLFHYYPISFDENKAAVESKQEELRASCSFISPNCRRQSIANNPRRKSVL